MVNIKEIFSENKGVFVIAIFTAVVISMVSANPIPAYAGDEPFIGEIMFFAGNFAPRGWSFCDGQLLPIAQNTALFSLYGVTYGGDARNDFALPDMRGKIAVHHGTGPGLTNHRLGSSFGTETVTLNVAQMAAHTHSLPDNFESMTLNTAATLSDNTNPDGKSLGLGLARLYSTNAPTIQLHENAFSVTGDGDTSSAGSSQSHPNMPPFQTITCNVALQGTFPSRN